MPRSGPAQAAEKVVNVDYGGKVKEEQVARESSFLSKVGKSSLE